MSRVQFQAGISWATPRPGARSEGSKLNLKLESQEYRIMKRVNFESSRRIWTNRYWYTRTQKELDGDEVKHYPSSETASPLLGLHIKRLTLDHFSHGQMTIACCAVTSSSHHRSGSVTEAKAFIRTELGATTTTTTTTSGIGGDQRQPLVNRLRPAVSTTATGDKRRSTQQSPTGHSLQFLTRQCYSLCYPPVTAQSTRL